MSKKMTKRYLSILLSAIMLMSVFVTAFSFETQAITTVDIKIANVTRKYQEAATFLNMCNDYRRNKNLSDWTMDSELMELAMKRAAELAIYPSLDSPGGSNYLDSENVRGQLIGINVFNLSTLINSYQTDPEYYATLNADDMNAAGVGIVTVRNKKYVCLLASNKTVKTIDSSVLTQADKTLDQQTSVYPAILSNVKLNYNDQQTFYCGSTMNICFAIKNNNVVTAWLTADCGVVSSSNTKAFTAGSNGAITGVRPGTSNITLKLKNYPSITASAEYIAVAKSLADCIISDIPDQYYTGSPIMPSFTVESYSGEILTKDKDYTVSYTNNINVGTASVTVTGIGAYIDQTASAEFKIINDPNTFKVSGKVSKDTLVAGGSTTITASVTGGTSPIKYKFEAAPSESTSYTVIQAEGTASSCSYQPSAAGTYNIRITAKDSANRSSTATVTVTVKPALDANISLSSYKFTLGNTVTIKASATGGFSPYTYDYAVIVPDSTSWTTLSSNSSAVSYSYKPSKAGIYQFRVQAKDSAGNTSSEVSTLTVEGATLTNNTTVSKTSFTVGETVTVKGAASGGNGTYTYEFYYKRNTATAWTKFGSAATATFKPSSAGTFNIRVYAKDSAGASSVKDFTLTAKAALVNNTTVSKTNFTVGETVTVKGAASGGSGTYTYEFYYKRNTATAWTKFGSAATAAFKPSSAGIFNIRVYAKDSAGASAVKDFTVTAESLANNSTVSKTSFTVGEAVTVKGAASGGSGTYTYEFYYKKSTASTWTKFGSAATATFKPSSAGIFNIRVYAKDSKGASAVKDFMLIANSAGLLNNTTVSKTNFTVGETVTVKGAASGGSGTYTYEFYYKRSTSSTWTKFGSAATATFKPSSAGTFNIRVYAKDSKGAFAVKDFTVTAK